MPDRIEMKTKGTVYFLDNKEVSEKAYRKRHPVPTGEGIFRTSKPSAWPCWGDSLGCHPKDAAEFMANARARGVPTTFCKKTGRIQWESRDHQRRYCQEFGYHNRDDTWSGKGPKTPPEPPKKRPKMGKANQQISKEPPKMRTATKDYVDNRPKRSRRKSR